MKLIDVDPIIKNLSAMKVQLGYDAIDIDGMIKALRDEKEADVATVVHGRWTGGYMKSDSGQWYYEKPSCSECGEESFGFSKYCPNCGAKMYEEDENGLDTP